jgi:hypothetical protein
MLQTKRYTFYALGEILMRHSHTEATSRFRRNPNLHTRVMLSSFKLRVNAIPISSSTQSSSRSEMKITLSPLHVEHASWVAALGNCVNKNKTGARLVLVERAAWKVLYC